MKRLFAVVLVLVLALGLSGCCLKHDMQPATCTEPSTCSKCGKTEGEPLGHTEEVDAAVEPTCTETGLTEGKHCSVCGEVLVEQETIEALGHEWEDATFMKPKTCSRCGETEGEALGSQFFVQELFRDAEEDGAEEAVERTVKEPASQEAAKYEFLLTGSAHGFDLADEWVPNSSVKLMVNTEQEDLKLSNLDVVFNGSEPVNALIAADKEGLTLYMPGTMDEQYTITYEKLTELLQPYMEGNGITVQRKPADMLEGVATEEELRALAEKYVGILVSVANIQNTSEKLGSYELQGLGEKQLCMKLTCTPEPDDWRTMLRTLFTTMKEDELLQNVLAEMIRAGAKNAAVQNTMDSAGLDDPEDLIASIPGWFDAGLENVDNIAQALDGYGFEVATGAKRLYALKIANQEGGGFGYESYGDAEQERKDALVLYSEGTATVLALNTVKQTGKDVNGTFTFSFLMDAKLSYVVKDNDGLKDFDVRFSVPLLDMTVTSTLDGDRDERDFRLTYDASGQGVQLDVKRTESTAEIMVPNGDQQVIESEDDLNAMMSRLSEAISQTDLAAKVAEMMAAA